MGDFSRTLWFNATHMGDNSGLEGIFVGLHKSSQGYINILEGISYLSLPR